MAFFNYMENAIVSNWTGSVNTYELVKKQILDRFGQDDADNYDPARNCFTFNRWLKQGYRPKRGQKPLKSIVVFKERDEQGKIVRNYIQTVKLFYVRQVEKIRPND